MEEHDDVVNHRNYAKREYDSGSLDNLIMAKDLKKVYGDGVAAVN